MVIVSIMAITITNQATDMFKKVHRDQELLLPSNLRDLFPEDDLVVFIVQVVERLKLQLLTDRYAILGQHAYHPGMLLALLFYSYAKGVFASRKIAECVRYDVRFMYICGMNRPDFRTISDFRKNHRDLLKDYFVQIVMLCMEAGLAPLRDIAIDGSKIKANASGKRTLSRKQLSEQLRVTEAEIDQLLQLAADADAVDAQSSDDDDDQSLTSQRLRELEDRREALQEAQKRLDENPTQGTINFTDPDCRSQKSVGPGYNTQIAVDASNQIIVAADVVSDVSDNGKLNPMIDQLEENTDSKGQSKRVAADAGYGSLSTYRELLTKPHIDAYAPTREGEHRRRGAKPFDKGFFRFSNDLSSGECPLGKPMRHFKSDVNRRGDRIEIFRGVECTSCPSRNECTRAKYRTVSVLLDNQLIEDMEDKVSSPSGRAAMRMRRSVVEPAFGQLKEHIGFRQFRLRGLPNVRAEFVLLCAAFNLRKLYKALSGGKLAQSMLSEASHALFLRLLRRFLHELVIAILFRAPKGKLGLLWTN